MQSLVIPLFAGCLGGVLSLAVFWISEQRTEMLVRAIRTAGSCAVCSAPHIQTPNHCTLMPACIITHQTPNLKKWRVGNPLSRDPEGGGPEGLERGGEGICADATSHARWKGWAYVCDHGVLVIEHKGGSRLRFKYKRKTGAAGASTGKWGQIHKSGRRGAEWLLAN